MWSAQSWLSLSHLSPIPIAFCSVSFDISCINGGIGGAHGPQATSEEPFLKIAFLLMTYAWGTVSFCMKKSWWRKESESRQTREVKRWTRGVPGWTQWPGKQPLSAAHRWASVSTARWHRVGDMRFVSFYTASQTLHNGKSSNATLDNSSLVQGTK